MGSIVTRIKYGNVTKLREQYISVLDYKVFQVCDIDDNIITELLYKFSQMDLKKTGRLDLAEFYQTFDLSSKFISPMAKRLFLTFDIDQKGKVSFAQFVAIVFNLALASHKDLLNFVFDTYFFSLSDLNDTTAARDGKGHDQRSIRMEMVQTLLSEGFGSKKIDNKSKEVLDYLKSLPYRKQAMSKSEFFQYVKTNRKVLSIWVIFELQKAIRQHVFGEPFWAKLLKQGRRPPGVNGSHGLEENFVQMTFDRADPEKNKEFFKKERKAKQEARSSRSYSDGQQLNRGKRRF